MGSAQSDSTQSIAGHISRYRSGLSATLVALSERDRYGLAALLAYLALSVLFFGRSLIGHFAGRYIGMGSDPSLMAFFLEWWRYALVHHLNPFHVNVAWAPSGFNLAWTTCIPLTAWAVMPIEALFGPIPAYNVALLLCPALAGWAAFILCRYITRSYWPSLAGGYLFGFSPYVLGSLLGHLQMATIFLLPLAVYLVLRRLNGELTDRRFTVLAGLLLVAQFLCSLEVLAAMSMAGAVAMLLAYYYGDRSLRRRIRTLLWPLATSYLLTAVLMSPYVYYFFRDGQPPFGIGLSFLTSSQPLSLFVPVSTNIFGGWKIFRRLAPTSTTLWDAGEYVGFPLFVLFCSFAWSRRKEFTPRLLTAFIVLSAIATFGPVLRLGHLRLPMPWLIPALLPVTHLILPARLSVYMFLGLAIVAAMWLSNRRRGLGLRLVAAAAVIVSVLPNLSARFWTVRVDTPRFFRDGIYKRYLAPGENVVILPYGHWGDSDIWLASTRMYFRMAGGYLSLVPAAPPAFAQYPIISSLDNLADMPGADQQLKAFLAQKDVGAVIVADQGSHLWLPAPGDGPVALERKPLSAADKRVVRRLFSGLGVPPIKVGGVTLYRVPLERLRPYRSLNPRTLQLRAASARFAKLIEAAHRYVENGFDIDALTPLRAQQLGFLPPDWIGGIYRLRQTRSIKQEGLILGPGRNGMIDVGLHGPRKVLERLTNQYAPYVESISITPAGVFSWDWMESLHPALILGFETEGLARAAMFARTHEAFDSDPVSANSFLPASIPAKSSPQS